MDRISPAVEKLKATLTSRPPVFTITPREDSDVKIASVWRTIMGYMWENSMGDMQMKQAIHDYAVSGLGYLYVYIDGEADFEICALDNSGNGPLSLTVYDENNKIALELEAKDFTHYSEIDELCEKDWDKDVEINPNSDDYENTLYLEKDYSGSVFYYEVESDEVPTKDDFLYSSFVTLVCFNSFYFSFSALLFFFPFYFPFLSSPTLPILHNFIFLFLDLNN